MKESFAVIGLGRFGLAVVQSLTDAGYSVLAIDRNPQLIEEVSDSVASAVAMDTTDKDAMLEIQITHYSCVIVGIGADSVECSIMTTALLSQFGVARIIARGIHDLHGRVLRSVGAHEIINPEAELGRRLGLRLAHPTLIEQVHLGPNVHLAEVKAPERFVGKTLLELGVRNNYDVSVVAIRRQQDLLANPQADQRIDADDGLIVVGSLKAVTALANLV